MCGRSFMHMFLFVIYGLLAVAIKVTHTAACAIPLSLANPFR